MKKSKLYLLAILAITVLSYWPALKSGFLYDDRFFVQENPKIREWSSLTEFFTDSSHSMASIFWDGIWRPLRSVSYLADYKIWGLNPFGFHLTSLLWHLLNIILLYFLLGKMFEGEKLRIIACLIFALHPVQTEAVTWISSRGDLMYAAFGIAAMIFYLHFVKTGKNRAAALSLLCLALALLSKETAVVFPVLMMIHDWLFQRGGKIRETMARWKGYLPYLALVAAYLAVRRLALGRVSQCPYWGDSFWTTVFTMLRAAVEYLRLLFLPLWLKVDYVYELSTSLWDWRVLGSLLVLAAVSYWAWRDAGREKYLAFGWLWLVTGLMPVSNLLPLTAIMAERFLYLPLVGFAVWCGHLAEKSAKPKLMAAVAVLMTVLMMTLTFRRNLEWQEPLVFWQTETRRSPKSFIAHSNLGNIYYTNGDLDRAEREYLLAINADSTYGNALSGLAVICARTGRYSQARQAAVKCLKYEQGSAGASMTLGICSAAEGQTDSALYWFSQAVKSNPGDPTAWVNLGIVYAQQGRLRDAIASYEKALIIAPQDFFLHNELAGLWDRSGDRAKAMFHWNQSLALNQDFLPARMNLAVALEKTDPEQAAAQWEIFLRKALEQGEPVNRAFVEKRIGELRKHVR